MNVAELDRLVRKYYGYIADLEGSGVEVLDLLFFRDKIQCILDQLTPDEELPVSLYAPIYELDALPWADRGTFLLVVGKEELQHARRGQASLPSHWWWYVDELKAPPEPVQEQHERLARTFTPAGG